MATVVRPAEGAGERSEEWGREVGGPGTFPGPQTTHAWVYPPVELAEVVVGEGGRRRSWGRRRWTWRVEARSGLGTVWNPQGKLGEAWGVLELALEEVEEELRIFWQWVADGFTNDKMEFCSGGSLRSRKEWFDEHRGDVNEGM